MSGLNMPNFDITKPKLKFCMEKEVSRVLRYTCERIKYFRRINNLSQADMADRLWMSQRAYHRLENGETSMTLDRIYQLAKIFNVSVDQLIGYDGEQNSKQVLNEVKEIKQQFHKNEKRIIKILKELKGRKPDR